MAKFESVRPGDPIKADVWNAFVAYVQDLDARLIKLESGATTDGPPQIDSIFPSGVLHRNDPVELSGRSFGVSRGAQRVSVDGLFVTDYTGSTDTRLRFRIPLVDVPEGGKTTMIVVENGRGTATWPISLVRVPVPVTNDVIDLIWDSVDINPIPQNQPIVLAYRLGLRAGTTATFVIDATVPQLGWTCQVLDAAKNPIPDRKITLNGPQEKSFFVRVQIPNNTAGQQFTVSVTASVGASVGSSSQQFTVNQQAQIPDPSISLKNPVFEAINDAGDPLPGFGSYNDVTEVIQLKPTSAQLPVFGWMRMFAEIEQQGDYTFTLRLISGGTGWTVLTGAMVQFQPLSGGPFSGTFTIDAGDFPGGATKANHGIEFRLQATAAAVETDILLSVKRQGSTQERPKPFTLVRI